MKKKIHHVLGCSRGHPRKIARPNYDLYQTTCLMCLKTLMKDYTKNNPFYIIAEERLRQLKCEPFNKDLKELLK